MGTSLTRKGRIGTHHNLRLWVETLLTPRRQFSSRCGDRRCSRGFRTNSLHSRGGAGAYCGRRPARAA
eukprot:scaffold3437_cov68-Phaeocystis_antarctica.AAC.2